MVHSPVLIPIPYLTRENFKEKSHSFHVNLNFNKPYEVRSWFRKGSRSDSRKPSSNLISFRKAGILQLLLPFLPFHATIIPPSREKSAFPQSQILNGPKARRRRNRTCRVNLLLLDCRDQRISLPPRPKGAGPLSKKDLLPGSFKKKLSNQEKRSLKETRKSSSGPKSIDIHPGNIFYQGEGIQKIFENDFPNIFPAHQVDFFSPLLAPAGRDKVF